MNQPEFSSNSRPVVALLTDFGTEDGYVGVMKGVIATIVPDVQIIDITHDVPPQDVASGAWIIATAYRYFPVGTVYVCVVDPGVGSTRRAMAARCGDWFFVGPDNGLFSYIYAEQGVGEAVVLSNPAYQLASVSSTFHGRDIFAPAGGHLARGVALQELGESLDPATLVRLDIERAVRQGSQVDGHIVHVDHFGNLISNIPLEMVPELFSGVEVQMIFKDTHVVVDRGYRFFAESPQDGQPFIYADSSGYAGVAVRNGNASHVLGVGFGAGVSLAISC